MIHNLIDADRILYCFGGLKDEEGSPQPWEIVRSRIDDNINLLNLATRADSFELVLTSDDKSNFRFNVATILPYKGNRLSDKPFWYQTIRSYLVDTYRAHVVYGMEADDYLGIQQSENTVISSVDKDLDNIPGKHFNELKPNKGVYEISEVCGWRNYFCQCLLGDDTDNIMGLYGVGRASALLKRIHTLSESRDMYLDVKAQYLKRFGSHWKMFLWENASLLWIKRKAIPEGQEEILELLQGFEAA